MDEPDLSAELAEAMALGEDVQPSVLEHVPLVLQFEDASKYVQYVRKDAFDVVVRAWRGEDIARIATLVGQAEDAVREVDVESRRLRANDGG